MWTALGLYAFGPNRKDLREYRKLRRRRKTKSDRHVIIPEEAFLANEDSLVHLDEIRIQEEPYIIQDGSSVSYESENTKFKYSMGGNVKFYDEHIALTSPRKKVKSPSRRSKLLDESLDSALNSSPARSTFSSNCGSMDMTPRIINGPTEGLSSLNEPFKDRLSELTMDMVVANETPEKRAQIITALNELKITEHGTARGTKISKSSTNVANSIAKVDSWKTDFSHGQSLLHSFDEDIDKNDQNVTNLSKTDSQTSSKKENVSSRSGGSLRDYSPIRSKPLVTVDQLPEADVSTPTTNRRNDDHVPSGNNEQIAETTPAPTGGVLGAKPENPTDIREAQRGERQDSLKINRYNRTLLYVNEQNETIQNGDYTELNGDLSDLSSDVFTDSEVPTSGFLSQSRDGKSDLDFYPDSPTTEQAFSKTPCSSRKNSLDSCMSDDSMSMDGDFKTGGPEKTAKLIPNEDMHAKSHAKQNGKVNETSEVKPKSADLKNVKAKVGSTANVNYRPGGGVGKIESKKLNFTMKAKPKVNCLRSSGHAPGGGLPKASTEKNHYRKVEPRTDTHGVEAYSHLPSEFQEIAKRLAKQDRMLRDSKTSGSSSSGRSRPHSRRSSHASSRAGSVSPDRRSVSKSTGRHLGSSVNLSTSTTTLANYPTRKNGRRTSMNRSPSIRSRPTTPSLSRSHPATFVTPYDSRSRPNSRPTSRSTSPVSRSRNTSPSTDKRSRGSSPVANHRRPTTSTRKPPASNRPRAKIANGIRGRSTNTVGLSSMEIGLSSRSVFQVVPFYK